jgi:hypothetical protein
VKVLKRRDQAGAQQKTERSGSNIVSVNNKLGYAIIFFKLFEGLFRIGHYLGYGGGPQKLDNVLSYGSDHK